MSAFYAEAVRQAVAGMNAANFALDDLRNMPAPDLLLERLQAVLVTGEPERLRAFMRTLQKRLEARA